MDEEMTELMFLVSMMLTMQLESSMRDLGSATCFTLFLLRDSTIMTDKQSASRAYNHLVVNYPDRERGRPLIWFFKAMLEATEKFLSQNTGSGDLIFPDQGKAEAVETLRKTVDDQKPHELNAWVKACRHLPSFERLGQPPMSRIVFAVEGFISCREEAGSRWGLVGPPYTTQRRETHPTSGG